MKPVHLMVAIAAIAASSACNADKGNDSAAPAGNTITATAPPKGGDWTQVVNATPEGGFMMGNPAAAVKLVEFGSMTCPHCADFEEAGGPGIEAHVKTGKLSFEFRNYVRDPYDLTSALIARCGGPQRFFPLTRAMYADQKNWIAKLSAVPPEQMQSMASLPPTKQFLEIAKLAGFQQWAAMRGVPSAKSSQCLANEAEINKLVQMNSDATATYNIPGTPSFLINNKLVDKAASWKDLEPKIKEALGS